MPPPTPPTNQAELSVSKWFSEEVQPHEPALRAYLHRKFPTLADVDDLVQESYLRLIQTRVQGSLRSARGFLFTAARNTALDIFRRRRTASLDAIVEFEELRVLDNKPDVAEIVSRDEELVLLTEAIESLPKVCRQILKLRKIYGLSHKEIAEKLGISERTVNVQICKGVKRCVAYLEHRGVVTRDSNAE